MINLGTLDGDIDSQAMSINLGGEIVGESFGTISLWRAFYYSSAFGMLELKSLIDNPPINSRDIMATPLQINDTGTISGTIRLEDFTIQAFVLTPNP